MTGEDEILRFAQDDSGRSLRVMLRGDPDRQLHYQWHSPTKSCKTTPAPTNDTERCRQSDGRRQQLFQFGNRCGRGHIYFHA